MTDRNSLILEAITNYPEGFTLDGSGKPIQGKTGYLVGGSMPALEAVDMPSQEEIVRWLFRFDIISRLNPNYFIGGWRDEDGKFYLDATILVDKKLDAWVLGSIWNQQAVGVVKDGKYVDTISCTAAPF